MSALIDHVRQHWPEYVAEAKFILYMGFAFTLFFTCFCRMAIMSKPTTRRDIRWSFTALGLASIFALLAPLYGYEPDGMATMLLASMSSVQVATAYHWRNGLPPQYRKGAG